MNNCGAYEMLLAQRIPTVDRLIAQPPQIFEKQVDLLVLIMEQNVEIYNLMYSRGFSSCQETISFNIG